MTAATLLRPSVAALAETIRWDLALAVIAIGGAALVGLGGSLYPAIRAARLDPTVALRAL
jgi:putative ABC transport system permease protein